jgi:ketosteroid isomerase-like protein
MATTSNVQIVQDAYNNFKAGNLAGVLAHMDPSIEWVIPDIPNVRVSGTRHGRDRVQQFFTELVTDQDSLLFDPREFIADGDNVVALGKYEWRVKATGRSIAADFAHVFTIRNGQVTRFQEFMDSRAFAEAYRA